METRKWIVDAKILEELALMLQKYTRSKLARKRVILLRWERFQRAAYVIQHKYRTYRLQDAFRKAIHRRLESRKKKNMILLKNQRRDDTDSKSKNIIENIFGVRASFEDKLAFWRKAVELRRAHNQYPTDVIMKSLIAAKGELNRGLVLIGNVDFALRQLSDLPSKVRKTLLPIEPGFEDDAFGTNTFNHTLLSNSISSTLSQHGNTQVDVIRALKLRQEIQRKEENERQGRIRRGEYCEGGIDVSKVVSKCYFSKHFKGYDILQRKPRYIDPIISTKNKLDHSYSSSSPRVNGPEEIEDFFAGMHASEM